MKNEYRRIVFILTCVVVTSTLLLGCKEGEDTSGSANSGRKGTTVARNNQDDYSGYIRDALTTVSEDREPQPTQQPEEKVQNIFTNKENVAGTPIPIGDENTAANEAFDAARYEDEPVVSAEDALENSDEEADEDSADTSDDSTDSEDDSPTPDDFEVGTSCIYIKGELDSGYSADLIKCLNKARTDMGYPELTERVGLDKCADRRTREITYMLGHMRPNGLPFYSLAPDYFKAEMLAIDKGTAEETVDAWIRDPVSRALVFNSKYTSVGAAGFKTNDIYYSAMAFGY